MSPDSSSQLPRVSECTDTPPDPESEPDPLLLGSPYSYVDGGSDQSVQSKIIEATILASLIATLGGDLVSKLGDTIASKQDEWLTEARAFVECADGPPPTTGLLSISGATVLTDSADVLARGFTTVFNEKANALRFRGAKKIELAALWAGYPDLEKLLHLTEFGQEEFVKEGFVRNGSLPFKQSQSYYENLSLCNHHIAKMAEDGKTLILTMEAAAPTLPLTHLSPMMLALKPGDSIGRLCNNLSKGGSKSINKNIDLVASDRVYPLGKLPTIRVVCEIACVQRTKAGGDPISGGTVDVAGAYQRTTENPAHSLLTATQVKVELEPGFWAWCVIYFCTMIFGFTRAGHVYMVYANAIHWMHNKYNLPGEEDSCTYIDDGIIISRESPVQPGGVCTASRVSNYVLIIRLLFGPGGSQKKKQILWENRVMIAIGWLLDLNYDVWRVTPKPRALVKMYAALYVRIPKGQKRVAALTLMSVLSLLRWYTVGLPLCSAFLGSLNSCLYHPSNRGSNYLDLSPEAEDDLDFFRAVVTYARVNPKMLGASIDHVRTNVVVNYAIYSDACTSVGGGSYCLVADDDEYSPDHRLKGEVGPDDLIVSEHVLRWTLDGLDAFALHEVNINVLELFAMMYEIIMCGNTLRGKAVKLYLDNSSAVSWLTKMRATVRYAVTLMRIISLYCCFMDMGVFSWHIPGVLNTYADRKSRLPDYVDYQAVGWEASKDERWWTGLSREDTCRRLLLQLAVAPSPMLSLEVLALVEHLLPPHGSDTSEPPDGTQPPSTGRPSL